MDVGNERGRVLNTVLTAAEGVGLLDLCRRGLVRRYEVYAQAPPEVIYVDCNCCTVREGEQVQLAQMLNPWETPSDWTYGTS